MGDNYPRGQSLATVVRPQAGHLIAANKVGRPSLLGVRHQQGGPARQVTRSGDSVHIVAQACSPGTEILPSLTNEL
ncbi:hypothetical protein J6590_016823 [Homalodisca vitripennis]|nr:hypothetical protein J6590_016823 [Homalodisca vitripennis]